MFIVSILLYVQLYHNYCYFIIKSYNNSISNGKFLDIWKVRTEYVFVYLFYNWFLLD